MKIKHIWTIFTREFLTYFNTVIGYVFMVVFLLLSVGLYMNTFFVQNRIEMRSFFENMPLLLAVFLPAVSMRLWSEDRRGNTLELLLTFPMSITSIMLGKFLASLAFFGLTLLGTISIPILLFHLGEPDLGPIQGAYLGTILLASYYLAIGTFISGFFKDQIVAFILGMVLCLGLWLTSENYFAIFLDGSWPTIQLGTLLKEFIGIRFSNLAKGLLDFKDVFYYLSFSAAFLYLNQLFLRNRRPVHQGYFLGIVVLVLTTTIFFNACFYHTNLPKVDLTKHQIFTLSPSSKKILQTLPHPISLHFYINNKESLPTDMRTLEQSVMDLLQELKEASKRENKYYLNYHLSHPRIPPKIPQGNNQSGALSPFEQKFSSEEFKKLSPEEQKRRLQEQEKVQAEMERLQWKGITPFPKQTIESDTMEIRDVYSGIAISYMDENEEIITPLTLQNLNNLEYDILNRIQKLITRRPRILVYAPKEEDSFQNRFLRKQGMDIPPPRDPFKGVIQFFAQAHNYNLVRTDFTQPLEGDLFILFQPEKLNKRQEFEINRALASGMPVIIANQSVLYDFSHYFEAKIPIRPAEKDINHLLENYGIKQDPRILLDENLFSARLYNDIPGFDQAKEFHFRFPINILVAKQNQNENTILMKGFANLPMVFASAFELNPKKLEALNLKTKILCTSSKKSWFYRPREDRLTVKVLTSKQTSQDRGEYPLALLVEGQFPDLYQGKARPKWPKQDPNQEVNPHHIKEDPERPLKQRTNKAILIGSSAMFAPENPHPVNFQEVLSFLKNCIDYLTLGEDIVQIRTKNTEVQKIDPSLKPSEKTKKKNFAIFLIPSFVILLGIGRFFIRYLRKKYYLIQIQSKKRSQA